MKYSTKFKALVGPLLAYSLLVLYTALPMFDGGKSMIGAGLTSFSSGKLFSWHPFLMVLGFITLAGNAAIIKQTKGKENMVMHGNFMSGAIIFAFLGWYAIYDTKVFNKRLMPLTEKSLHGQLGIFVMVMYLVVGMGGSLAFHPDFGLASIKSSPYNSTFRLIHKWSGRFLTALAWYTCVLGARKSYAVYTKEPSSYLWLEAPLLIIGLLVLLVENTFDKTTPP